MGIKSSGWFGDVLAGRQRLRPAHIKSIATVFKLNTEEQKCLHALVEMDIAETPEECAHAYEKWYQVKGIGQEIIAKDRFKFYEQWYYSAFRELLSLYPGENNPEVLAAAMDPAITPKQAREAIKLLERLGMIVNGDPKSSRPSAPVLVKDPEARTRHWKKMMFSMMKLGQRALDRYGRDERDFSGLTLTFSPEGMKKAGEEVTALRKRLLYLSEKDKKSDRVFNCLFQIYPVTTPLEVSRA